MINFLARAPFAAVTAFGFIGIASNFVNLKQNILDWLGVWQAFYGFLFGWIPVSDFWQQYLAMSLIMFSSYLRSAFHDIKLTGEPEYSYSAMIGEIFLWSLFFWWYLLVVWTVQGILLIYKIKYSEVKYSKEKIKSFKTQLSIFYVLTESYLFAAIIIASSYLFS